MNRELRTRAFPFEIDCFKVGILIEEKSERDWHTIYIYALNANEPLIFWPTINNNEKNQQHNAIEPLFGGW